MSKPDAIAALDAFLHTPLGDALPAAGDTGEPPLALFRRTAASVPAYATFLREHRVDPATVRTREDFARLPLVTKASYVERHPLAERCREGELADLDMVALSSGSTGAATLWPRAAADELAVAARFEQVFSESFEADRRRTLAVVCFPLGTWVGGMYTASCCRHLAAKGYRITTVTPGNDRAEILRACRALSPMFDQTVLLGYPPFVKDVIDAGAAEGVPWRDFGIKLVLAGEVFSEAWRSLMCERAGMTRPPFDSASLYGTADAGVLGVETPLSIVIRRFCAERDEAARALFGQTRLPTLVQYDPRTRYFEQHEGTLVVSADGGVPLVRYHIADDGGVAGYDELLARVGSLGLDAVAAVRRQGERGARALPFVWVFGRSHFAVSFYGANVFPEMIALGLEQPSVREWVTGKFVVEARETADRDRRLAIAVELAAGVSEDGAMRDAIADSVLAELRRLSSEFAHYVPAHAQRPDVSLHAKGDPAHFPVGVKHRYVRTSST
jgi:phenylacetate-CoA ligase